MNAMNAIHTATPQQCAKLWPAVSADHLFPNSAAFKEYCKRAPWSVRTTDRGEAALLGTWREHLDVLAIRTIWSAERDVPDFVADAVVMAGEQGFARVLSPLLPDVLLGGYRGSGMRIAERIVAIQGHPELVLRADPPIGVRIRAGTADDIAAVATIDAASFSEFWRYDEDELAGLLGVERLAVAEASGGAVIGYTLTTVSRGSATLSRLATAPHARTCGVGRALLAESAAWSVRSGAVTFSLCTQEANSASRRLYATAGLSELAERYAFAICDVTKEARP